MLSSKDWSLHVLLPFVLVLTVDQVTKHWANSVVPDFDFGFIRLTLHHNKGFIFGSMSGFSKLYTVVVPSAIGAFLLYIFFVVQYFLPIRSLLLRAGLSVFVAGVLSNVIDRALLGYVVDFVQVPLGNLSGGIFNLADVLQWCGVATFFYGWIKAGRLLYPANERRERRWIDGSFQLRFCLILVFVGASFAAIALAVSWTYLDVAVANLPGLRANEAAAIMRSYALVYGITVVAYLLSLFLIGMHLSYRIAGPIRGFENYIEDLLAGETRKFKLRRSDELLQLERIASRFHHQFHEKLGIVPPALKTGMMAPEFAAPTFVGRTINIRDYLGRKIWLIFYRYATCPLCVLHLKEIKSTIADAKAAGMEVIAVFETEPAKFLKPDSETGATAQFLKSMDIPMVADPNREVYRAYRNRTNVLALLKPSTIVTLGRARKNRFKQGSIDGKLGQLPSHFFIDTQGMIQLAYYGKDMVDHIDIESVREFFGS